jgi:hypothetical protein
MHFTISIDIDADADRVWATMIDIERWPEWTASVTSVNRLDSGPFGQDSRARVAQPRLPAAVWQVTRFEPNAAFAWVSKRGGVRTEGFHGVRRVHRRGLTHPDGPARLADRTVLRASDPSIRWNGGRRAETRLRGRLIDARDHPLLKVRTPVTQGCGPGRRSG